MCLTSAPAKLSNTLIYVGHGIRNDVDVHVIAYQNKATNESAGPNSMILPFPTDEEMTEENIIDTSKFPKFLENITNATKMQMRTLGDSDTLGSKGISRGFKAKVFDVGSYTVVLATDVMQVAEALERVPENKRPTISDEFLGAFGSLYPNQPLAICCWDGKIEAEPLLWWYVPKNKDHFFVPTMDAHDGGAPKFNVTVETDHIISTGSTVDSMVGQHFKVTYDYDFPSEVRDLLPNYVYSTKMGSTYNNGDMFIATDKLGADANPRSWNFDKMPKAYRGVSYKAAQDSKYPFSMFGWG